METTKELANQSIVIIAQSFNPSIFNHYWLDKNKIINHSDINSSSVITPALVQVSTPNLNLIITTNQLQFNPMNNNSGVFELIENKLIRIIDTLKEIPYQAIGINFNWILKSTEVTFSEFCRELFFFENSKIHENFNKQDAKFGAYLSKDFENVRLKLDIKPITDNKDNKEAIQFGFNFHTNLEQESCVKELTDTLKNWKLFKEESENIISSLW